MADRYGYHCMIVGEILDCGWTRDLPDHRDYSPAHPAVRSTLKKLARTSRKELPNRIDIREYCAPIDDQQGLGTSSAHACIGMIQYFERRSTGRVLRPARLFLHSNARRLDGHRSEGD